MLQILITFPNSKSICLPILNKFLYHLYFCFCIICVIIVKFKFAGAYDVWFLAAYKLSASLLLRINKVLLPLVIALSYYLCNFFFTYRLSKRGSSFKLGNHSWLDGISLSTCQGVLFAVALRDDNVCLKLWPVHTDN